MTSEDDARAETLWFQNGVSAAFFEFGISRPVSDFASDDLPLACAGEVPVRRATKSRAQKLTQEAETKIKSGVAPRFTAALPTDSIEATRILRFWNETEF